MKRLAACILGAVFAVSGCAMANGAPGAAATATAIPLFPLAPAETIVGHLRYRGGIVIEPRDARVGGLSGLIVAADGNEMIAVSDMAYWFRARLTYDMTGNLDGIDEADIRPMRGLDGISLQGKAGDAEGLSAFEPGLLDGAVLVSFERDHRVWLYDLANGFDTLPEPIDMPSGIATLNANGGIEGIAVIGPNEILAVSEETRNSAGDYRGWIVPYPPHVGRGGYGEIGIVPREPYAITDAAAAPTGEIYLLERRYSLAGGVGMRVRRVSRAEIAPGVRVLGEELAELSGHDANIDNMEGIAVRTTSAGETLLYVISDDNYQAGVQRTLLLMFEVIQ